MRKYDRKIRKLGFFFFLFIRPIKYRTCDNAKVSTQLHYLAIYYLQSRGRGREREERNAQQLQQSTVEILKCEVPMKRARNILSQRIYAIKRGKSFLNATYFLFWNIIFLLTAQCQCYATFVSISRLGRQPSTIPRFKFHASIILSLIIRQGEGIEKS